MTNGSSQSGGETQSAPHRVPKRDVGNKMAEIYCQKYNVRNIIISVKKIRGKENTPGKENPRKCQSFYFIVFYLKI
jgi:hypothetical protein